MDVHRHLGHGFAERVYEEALAWELERLGIPFASQVGLPIHYRGTLLASFYRADFVCFGQIIVEVKAMSDLTRGDEGQVINYLRASGLGRGLLLNFGAPRLTYRRLVW